ncbi:alpha-L-fucosidase [Microbacterium sp. LWO13-1.2]|uniref:alpha-L-fucosidase n=1 Tax=Microbacterium sp. LWO13-1.2 TaxID=3135262 RepID=UPI00313A0185
MIRVTSDLWQEASNKGVPINTSQPAFDWFTSAKFGIFLHFGHSAHRGWELSWQMTGGVEGQFPAREPVACAEYFANASEFDPQQFDAEEWAAHIHDAGARYAVFTTKHHDGFAMFDTAHSDYSITRTSPFGRDITAELTSALRARGIRVGLYFSLPDWHHADYPPMTDATTTKPYRLGSYVRTSPTQWASYRAFFLSQLTEILTRYGAIDVLWLDGEFEHTAEEWDFAGIREHVRTLQPDCLVNDRCVGHGDFATPEQQIPAENPDAHWEICMTMNDSWGWTSEDDHWKSTPLILSRLVETITGGGNLLLNVGPQGDGTFPPEAQQRLREIGEWMRRNDEAVTDVVPVVPGIRAAVPLAHRVTASGETLFLYCTLRPWDTLTVSGVPVNRVSSVRALGFDDNLGYRSIPSLPEVHSGTSDPLGDLEIMIPATVADSLMPVIAVTLTHESLESGPLLPD